jgi:hypothetical protein
MTNKNSGLRFRRLRATPAVEPAGALPAEKPGAGAIAGQVLKIPGASLPGALGALGTLGTLGAQVSIRDTSHRAGRTGMTARDRSLRLSLLQPGEYPAFVSATGLAGFGNSSVGLLREPGQRNLALSVERAFEQTEPSGLSFRTEAFNFTRTPGFDQQVNDDSAGGAFRVISSPHRIREIVQLALKYQF